MEAPQKIKRSATPRRQVETSKADAAPASTKSAILAAARHEFATKGAGGARVNEIAERSGANKQLIYYYFGNKKGLYEAALEAVYSDIREHEKKLKLDEEEPEAAMRSLVSFSFDYLAEHPEFIGMLNHENAVGAANVRTSEAIQGMNSPLIELIRKTLKRGVQAGQFRKGIDPLNLYISIAGMSYFFFSNRLTLSLNFGRDLSSKAAEKTYRRHVVDFTLAGIKN